MSTCEKNRRIATSMYSPVPFSATPSRNSLPAREVSRTTHHSKGIRAGRPNCTLKNRKVLYRYVSMSLSLSDKTLQIP